MIQLINSVIIISLICSINAFGISSSYLLNNPDTLDTISENTIINYSLTNSVIHKFPFRSQNYINRFFPGVVSYFQDFYIRGGESYETGFFIDGIKFNDLFTGINSFIINPNVFEEINFYSGFIPSDFGNVSSGLFDMKLRTGGDKLSVEAEHYTDNITFTSDPFSGNKKLGAYFYGHNETNLNIGGPLYFDNIKFFTNVNYLFQRDKNPQRYPGIDDLFLNDQTSLDSITINLPAGIVPFNSFESINILSTLLFELDNVKIKASGIYFNEYEFTERQHLLDYLNSRTGYVNNSGGFIIINLEHKLSEIISYSLNGNFYRKSEITTDPYLGDNYWTYGDSVSNANAGIFWERSVKDINGGRVGRYSLPSIRNVLGFGFTNIGYPGVNYKKSLQERLLFKGSIKFNLDRQHIRIGGEYSFKKFKLWEVANQNALAGLFASFRSSPNFDDVSNEELRELILYYQGVNNFGYNLTGADVNPGRYTSPEPEIYSLYVDDQIRIIKNLTINAGIRFDHFDFNFKKMIDPSLPDKTFNRQTGEIIEAGLIDTDNYSFLSPRIAVDYFVIPGLSFLASYSGKVQSHKFSELYQGLNFTRYILASTPLYRAYVTTGDTKPIETKEYQFGIYYQPSNNIKTGAKYYNKISKNLLSINEQNTNPISAYHSYLILSSDRTQDIWGLEFDIEYYNKGLILISNLGYQKTDIEDIDQRSNKIIINTFLNYDFMHFLNISDIFREFNLSALFTFNTGHPYYVTGLRYPDIPFSGTTPNVYQLDLRLEKGFLLNEDIRLGLYVYVINLFDTKNVYNVFPLTGSAENDGYLDNPAIVQQLVEVYGEQYITAYKLMNIYNPDYNQQTFYGPPRQIGLGIKLNY